MRKLSLLSLLGTCLLATSLQAGAYYAEPLSASVNPIGIHLKWSTYKELNLNLFVIEKSSDGQIYYEIGEQNAAGFSIIDNKYHFLDMENQEGTFSYRLRELSADGTISYSFVASAEVDHKRGLRVLNLSLEEGNADASITFDLRKVGSIEGYITDIRGHKIFEFTRESKVGINVYKQDMKDYPPGFYILHLVFEGDHERFTLWKENETKKEIEPVASTLKGKN